MTNKPYASNKQNDTTDFTNNATSGDLRAITSNGVFNNVDPLRYCSSGILASDQDIGQYNPSARNVEFVHSGVGTNGWVTNFDWTQSGQGPIQEFVVPATGTYHIHCQVKIGHREAKNLFQAALQLQKRVVGASNTPGSLVLLRESATFFDITYASAVDFYCTTVTVNTLQTLQAADRVSAWASQKSGDNQTTLTKALDKDGCEFIIMRKS